MNGKKAKKARKISKEIERRKATVNPNIYKTVKKMYTRGAISFLLVMICGLAWGDNVYFDNLDTTPLEMCGILNRAGFDVEIRPELVDKDTFGILYCEGSTYRLHTFNSVDEETLMRLTPPNLLRYKDV